MDPRQVLEAVDGSLLRGYPQLVFQLPTRRNLHAPLRLFDLLLREVIEWVRAARIRPHIRERNLLRCALFGEGASHLTVGTRMQRMRDGEVPY